MRTLHEQANVFERSMRLPIRPLLKSSKIWPRNQQSQYSLQGLTETNCEENGKKVILEEDDR